MRATFIILALIGYVYAAPQNDPRYAEITRYDSDNDGLGQYAYNVETSDGERQEERSEVVNPGTEQQFLRVTGSYSYLGPDGVQYTVIYVADENGFHPAGEHIPPAAGTDKKTPKLGIPSAAIASLAGGGLG